jgi:hypothetical protein
MEETNAFIDKVTNPSPAELSAALGPASAPWHQLVDSLSNEQTGIDQEWYSLKPKYGWTLLLKFKKRRIVYLGPCTGFFRVAFILSDKAVAAARQSKLPTAILKLLDKAPHYPEGTGLRMVVKTARDLPAIRKLAQIKLAN